MRVVLIGQPKDRARLRAAVGTSMDIVDEALTLSAARASGVPAEAFLVAPESPAPGPPTEQVETLTPREVDVLERLAEGLPNKAIATRLGISDQTVKFHVASICGKLGAINRTDAVRLAIQRGLVTI